MIVDDIIDTGGTLSAAAQTVMDVGAKEVDAVATHAVLQYLNTDLAQNEKSRFRKFLGLSYPRPSGCRRRSMQRQTG